MSFKIFFFEKSFSVSNSLDPDILAGLVWVQTVWEGYQQISLAGR